MTIDEDRDMEYPIIEYRDSTVHFGPKGPTDRIMERCQALASVVDSVPYKISLRFAFYRLWEERDYYFPDLVRKIEQGELNFGEAKEFAAERCYKSFSKAVHDGYFRPDTFEDQSSASRIASGGNYDNKEDWINSISAYGIRQDLEQFCELDERQDQEHQIILVFEAAAMWRQFEYYAKGYPVDLWSLGGQASNPHKYGLAQRIDELGANYPDSIVTICYFGDLDYHGVQIPETALGDIESWATAPFESYRIGVNTLPPGQWEAYSDQEAGEIITSAIRYFLDADKLEEWIRLEDESSKEVNEIIDEYFDLDSLQQALDDL